MNTNKSFVMMIRIFIILLKLVKIECDYSERWKIQYKNIRFEEYVKCMKLVYNKCLKISI
jgi:hypothetical protein